MSIRTAWTSTWKRPIRGYQTNHNRLGSPEFTTERRRDQSQFCGENKHYRLAFVNGKDRSGTCQRAGVCLCMCVGTKQKVLWKKKKSCPVKTTQELNYTHTRKMLIKNAQLLSALYSIV